MARWLILGALLVLALLLLTHTSGVLDDRLGDEGTSGDTLEQTLRAERAAAGAGAGAGEAPGLSSATAAKAREAEARARERAQAAVGGEPTGPYEIVVIDAGTLAPLDGVELRVDDGEGGELLGATDEQGRWDSQDAGVPSLAFRATRVGYVLFTGIAKPGEPVEVALHPGIALAAVLVRGAGEKPVAHATVHAWDEDFGTEVVGTGTDEEGRFRLRAVRPNHPLRFVVQAPGLAPYVHRALFDRDPDEPWLLRMPEGNRITGRVLGPAGRPVKGAVVWLMPPSRKPLDEQIARGRAEARRGLQERDIEIARTAATGTDEEGRFEFVGVEPLRDWQPVAFASSRHMVRGEIVRFADQGETREVEIHVGRSATLKVGVRDALGNAMTHAELRILTAEGRVQPGPGDTWEQGVLTLADLPPGPTTVHALLPGRPMQGDKATLRPEQATRIDLVFKGGGVLRGRVRDREGQPIWQAEVIWQSHNPRESVVMRTDENGGFHLQSLAGSKGVLTVRARDLPHTRSTYETFVDKGASTSGEPREIVLARGTAVVGRFPDLPAGTTLHCRMQAGGEVSEWPLRLDERGAFRRDGPDVDRPAYFFFYLRGRTPLIVHEPAPFSSGEVRDLGSLAFEDTNPRKGRVVDPEGRPVHGAKVTVEEAWSGRSTRTDAKGEFVLARLPDRSIRLRIEAPGGIAGSYVLEPASQFRRQDFHLQRGHRVLVIVQDRDGRAAAGFTVVARPRPKAWKPGDALPNDVLVTTDGKGRADLALPEGDCDIAAFHPSHPLVQGSTQVSVTAGPKKGFGTLVTLRLDGALR